VWSVVWSVGWGTMIIGYRCLDSMWVDGI
jgi:hypothetical protein